MAKYRNRKNGFCKGGYKSRKRPKGISRAGLPKIYPAGSDGGIARMRNLAK
jgi:hypothetical protein